MLPSALYVGFRRANVIEWFNCVGAFNLNEIVDKSKPLDFVDVLFSDIHSHIRLHSCWDLLPLIEEICPKWLFKTSSDNSFNGEPFLSVTKTSKCYTLSSNFMSKHQTYKNGVDTVCALIVELAWASLRDNPEWLCLHCGAVEFEGRLVVFPNARRAGKSTITTLLGLRGYKVFTDDFLAIEVSAKGAIHGISSGISTRMRKPWPICFSPEVSGKLDQTERVSSKQYSYHSKSNNMPIDRGARLSIGAIVLLERDDENELDLSFVKIEKTLKTIILQNFARATNSANILEVLYALVSQVSCYELKYSNAEDAISKLEEVFQAWDKQEPCLISDTFGTRMDPDFSDPNVPQLPKSNQSIKRNNDVVEYSVGEIRFLATPNGNSIFQLDEVSTGVWNALRDPITQDDIIDLFCYVFPDELRSTISADIAKLIVDFAKNGMIIRECESNT